MNNGDRSINYNINGNFIKSISIEGDYLQVHGNYIKNSQDSEQIIAQIKDLVNQLEKQGYSPQEAQQKVAQDWIQNNPNAKGKLVKLGKYISDAGASAVVGETTLGAIKLIFAALGIPLLF
jgi:hypothetical protein